MFHVALPSHDTTLQVVELNEFPKATGVVILWSPRVAKGLQDTERSFRLCYSKLSLDMFLTDSDTQPKHFKWLQSY